MLFEERTQLRLQIAADLDCLDASGGGEAVEDEAQATVLHAFGESLPAILQQASGIGGLVALLDQTLVAE